MQGVGEHGATTETVQTRQARASLGPFAAAPSLPYRTRATRWLKAYECGGSQRCQAADRAAFAAPGRWISTEVAPPGSRRPLICPSAFAAKPPAMPRAVQIRLPWVSSIAETLTAT